jgi:hypothetical protein
MVTSPATSNADTLSVSQSVSDNIPTETLPSITMESEELDSKEQVSLSTIPATTAGNVHDTGGDSR